MENSGDLVRDILTTISLFIAGVSLVLSYLNRKSLKSARITIEMLPEDEGIFLYLRNIGERVAYDLVVKINPELQSRQLQVLSVIPPKSSFRTLLLNYDDMKSKNVVITVQYHDPTHRIRYSKVKTGFDLADFNTVRISRPEDQACSTIKG